MPCARKTFPEPAVSRRLCWRNLGFVGHNPSFGIFTGILYLLLAWMQVADLRDIGLRRVPRAWKRGQTVREPEWVADDKDATPPALIEPPIVIGAARPVSTRVAPRSTQREEPAHPEREPPHSGFRPPWPPAPSPTSAYPRGTGSTATFRGACSTLFELDEAARTQGAEAHSRMAGERNSR